MMTSHKPLIALAAIALFAAGCADEAPPAAAQPEDDDELDSAPAVVAEKPPPVYDYEKLAGGMLVLIADAPECQKYRDELQAMAALPKGAVAERDPAKVVAEAHDAGCSKKAREGK